MNNNARGLWIEDSELSTSEIEAALEPAAAVIAAAGKTAEEAHAEMLEILETDTTPNQDKLYGCTWMQAERAISADVGEHGVMALA